MRENRSLCFLLSFIVRYGGSVCLFDLVDPFVLQSPMQRNRKTRLPQTLAVVVIRPLDEVVAGGGGGYMI